MAHKRSDVERQAAARRAAREGDTKIAAEYEVSQRTVARWRHEFGYTKTADSASAPAAATPNLWSYAWAGTSLSGRAAPPVYELLAGIAEEAQRNGYALPDMQAEPGLWEDILHDDTHHSTAIEGNPISRANVTRLLTNGGIQQGTLEQVLEVLGYSNAAQWVYREGLHPSHPLQGGELLNLAEVRQVHHSMIGDVWENFPPHQLKDGERAGSFRRTDLKQFAGGMKPVDWPFVHAEMEEWLAWVNSMKPKPVEVTDFLARMHARYEEIHPFRDGNGRSGRLLLSMASLRLGFPPIVIKRRQRDEYIAALQESHVGSFERLGILLASSLLEGYERLGAFHSIVINAPMPLRFLADDAGYKPNTLLKAAQRGTLRAFRDTSGEWRSTSAWVRDYQAGVRP